MAIIGGLFICVFVLVLKHEARFTIYDALKYQWICKQVSNFKAFQSTYQICSIFLTILSCHRQRCFAYFAPLVHTTNPWDRYFTLTHFTSTDSTTGLWSTKANAHPPYCLTPSAIITLSKHLTRTMKLNEESSNLNQNTPAHLISIEVICLRHFKLL